MCNKKSPYKQYLSSSFSHTLNSKNQSSASRLSQRERAPATLETVDLGSGTAILHAVQEHPLTCYLSPTLLYTCSVTQSTPLRPDS